MNSAAGSLDWCWLARSLIVHHKTGTILTEKVAKVFNAELRSQWASAAN